MERGGITLNLLIVGRFEKIFTSLAQGGDILECNFIVDSSVVQRRGFNYWSVGDGFVLNQAKVFGGWCLPGQRYFEIDKK